MNINLSAEGFSSNELKSYLADYLPDLETKLIEDETRYRGTSLLSDPLVLTAIVSASSSVLSAIIAAFASIYSTRRAEGHNQSSAYINIYTDSSDKNPSLSMPIENVVEQLPKNIQNALPNLKDLETKITRIEYINN